MGPEVLMGRLPPWLRAAGDSNPAPKPGFPKVNPNDPNCPYCNPGARAAGDGSSKTCKPHANWLQGLLGSSGGKA